MAGIPFTVDQVKALAPDTSSLKAAEKLTSPAKWGTTGCSEAAAWGLCQGSGSNPYQTRVDLTGPAFKCSCPSRKFPCKHGLALLLLLATKPDLFAAGDPPAWVTEWLDSRQKREEKKAERQEQKKEVDPETKQKRIDKRVERMREGVQDYGLWMRDVVRQGLAAARSQPHAYWRNPAARLVDAQAPGLASLTEEMGSLAQAGRNGWEREFLGLLGRANLLAEGLGRFDQFDPGPQADLQTALGWPLDLDEVRATAEPVEDEWAVLGIQVEADERLKVQRIWLQGVTTGRTALILNFAYGNQPLSIEFVAGMVCKARLAFVPSGSPMRALVLERSGEPKPIGSIQGHVGFDAVHEAFCEALAGNPWTMRISAVVDDVCVRHVDGEFCLFDSLDREVPISDGFGAGWELLAASGGHPFTIFGEWDGQVYYPLSFWIDGNFSALEARHDD